MPTPVDDVQHSQFLRLFAANEAALRTFVRSLLPSPQEAADVMQEVAVVLWQKFAGADEFRPWAFGVARNMVLRHLRSKARDRHVFDDELVSQLADESAAMEQRHLAQREALTACLQKLPTVRRDLALAAYTKGTRMDELAAQRGQTPMSLYKLLQRIRQVLLECVRRTLNQEELT
ncbi:sigma-70 family RNA polymerase sigma factor [Prosthecobacter sp.]|uniref:sigma-70 family RNA polymerase sigma factor n=1 Tax=Prosthecobacter sp. TaxID=1965333 RepID=UPI0037847730